MSEAEVKAATAAGARRDMREVAKTFEAELRERAPEVEEARRLPRDLSDRFAQAGLYRMCVPEVYGGLELPPAEGEAGAAPAPSGGTVGAGAGSEPSKAPPRGTV